ncbi:MAG: hypothetical protein M0P57_14300 [Syntrophales bacterium]|jgi:hypothetical protein|nr:hypothetical protein [Syntrophales bacterium]
MTGTTKIILAFFFGIFSSSFGAWLAHYFSECRRKNDDFNKAASEFRNAFLPEIVYLKHNAIINGGSPSDLCEYLRSGYLRHLKALEIFKNHLSGKNKKLIEKAWKEYCFHKDNPDILWFEQYSWIVQGKGQNRDHEFKILALDRIMKILEYAKGK